MIKNLHIVNFKSLHDFRLPPEGSSDQLSSLVCLVGLNGSGKSTVLQALDFISHLFIGDVKDWVERRRGWKKTEFTSQFDSPRKLTIPISLTVELDGQEMTWEAIYNCVHERCTWERLVSRDLIRLLVAGGKQSYETGQWGNWESSRISYQYNGSVMSQMKPTDLHPHINQFRECMKSLQTLELLSPSLMRRKSREAMDIGLGGEKLAGFLDKLSHKDQLDLKSRLLDFYPHLRGWSVSRLRGGWRHLTMHEEYSGEARIAAEHINDGFLRVIAILSQAYTDDRLVLIDEIENGMNPEVVEKLMDFLVDLGKRGKQVIVTTHSPVILNFLDDRVAEKAVYLLYRNPKGHAKAVRYFSLPVTKKKLQALGPGEVYADTPLSEVTEYLVREGREALGG